jgi:hypothetical protein
VNELDKKRKFIFDNLDSKNDSIRQIVAKDVSIIQTTLRNDLYKKGLEKELETTWTIDKLTPDFNKKLENFLADYKKYFQRWYNMAVNAKEDEIVKNEKSGDYNINTYKDRYYNESLADLVKNVDEKERIIEFKGQLYQQINPIFINPRPPDRLITGLISLPP